MKILWAGNEGEDGEGCYVSLRGSPGLLLSGLMGMEAQFQEDLPCLLREFQESDKDLRLSCSFLLCVSQRVRNLSIAGQSCVSCCLEWTAVCLHWSETGTGLPQGAWQIRRCFVLGNRGPRADVSTVLISQARWELSFRHGYQQRERLTLGDSEGQDREEDASMDRWHPRTRWAPSRSRCSISLQTPWSRVGRAKNPEWTEFTWNWLVSVLPSNIKGTQVRN